MNPRFANRDHSRSLRHRLAGLLVRAIWAFLFAIASPALASDPSNPPQPKGPVLATSTVGIEGTLLYRYRGPELRAQPVDDKSPIVVRIVQTADDNGATLYDLRFIAKKAGKFDLRRSLQRLDSKPLSDGVAEVTPAVVQINSILPPSFDGQVSQVNLVAVPRLGGYTLTLIALGTLWLAVPAYFILRRILRKAPAPPPPPPVLPTLADQLRPLVEAAIAGNASIADRAKLEMLLIAHWRDTLGLRNIPHRAAILKLREHDEASAILTAVEGWLHKPRNPGDPAPDLAPMLERYRSAAPIDLAAESAAAGHAKPVASTRQPTTGGRP